MLFITWRAIENKTYDKAEITQDMLNLGDELDEDIPITDHEHSTATTTATTTSS